MQGEESVFATKPPKIISLKTSKRQLLLLEAMEIIIQRDLLLVVANYIQ